MRNGNTKAIGAWTTPCLARSAAAAYALVAAAVVWLAVPPAPARAQAQPSTALGDAYRRYLAAQSTAETELGRDGAVWFARRLYQDLERQWADAPDGYTAADWADAVVHIAALDMEAVDQLVSGARKPFRAESGLHEYLIPSRADKTWQLVATYVPPTARPHGPAAVVLHGNPQTEAELLGAPALRRLADRTGTVLIAPFGRGNYDFDEPAASDVYDLLDTVQDAFPIDHGRTFLVGYSMGGFSVFKIGPRGGYRWAGVLCISGAILNSAVRPVLLKWKDMPLYVVTGAHDESVPMKYGEQTAGFLAAAGLPASFYEEPNGSHYLRTLGPSLQRAWDDMHARVTRPENVPVAHGGAGLPSSAPSAVTKP